ncbi:hypothetical protein LX95_02885 [Mesonia algae]|uniref:Lipoprotein n=1 Tax=Mesonia algae TaxID=213248 RepID=A0A2W7JRK3_9FLAO|nr:hypothetical protein [Mesonia algae]PZW37576.1 hypothetical protein LX95_02885 [Mesonia algae]
MTNYKTIIFLILSIVIFSCNSEVKQKSKLVEQKNNETSDTEPTYELEEKVKYRDTIQINYLKNKKLLNILTLLPESTMDSWEWSKKDRERTVEFIEKNNFIIDSTQMYNNIKYIKPNTIGIQVVDGFWTLSIYEFNENDYFVVTNDIVGDGNDIQTFNFKNGKLTPTKMVNWFSEFDNKLLLNKSTDCIELLEENQLTYNYNFNDKNIILISSWLLNESENKNCLIGNSIKYELNKEKRTFDIADIYWKKDKSE